MVSTSQAGELQKKTHQVYPETSCTQKSTFSTYLKFKMTIWRQKTEFGLLEVNPLLYWPVWAETWCDLWAKLKCDNLNKCKLNKLIQQG